MVIKKNRSQFPIIIVFSFLNLLKNKVKHYKLKVLKICFTLFKFPYKPLYCTNSFISELVRLKICNIIEKTLALSLQISIFIFFTL